MLTQEQAEVAAHDVIEIVGRRVGDVPRMGEILEVLGDPGHRHYRVRWDDGHESMFYPAGDTRIVRRRDAASLSGGVDELVALLRGAEVEFELLPHRRTQTATREARALGVLPQETAKTVIMRVGDGCVRCVVAASRRLSLEKLAAVVGPGPALLSESELAGAYPQFELGAVPPFGGPRGDRVVVDSGLTECEYVVLEAGVHDRSLRLRTRDLVTVAGAQVAEITT